MKLKELESYLQDVAVFEEPKIAYEQYPTTPHLAARILYTAHTVYDDIEDRAVGDFGCGCAVLSIAAGMLGAAYLVGFDIDADALDIAKANTEEQEISMDFIRTNIGDLAIPLHPPLPLDTIIMNPPFGTKTQKGIDMVFLEKALKLVSRAVYSLHKTSTRDHIIRKADEWGFKCEVLAELKFDVPMMYKFHKKKSVDIAVDLLRFSRK